jgi:L-ascorbate metabolism protein UlaG (beta-lactamase superfamily)
MHIEYLAHSSFLFRSQGGATIIIDPYSPDIGYRPISRSCDLIVVTHEHHDHNHIPGVGGRALVHRGSLSTRVLGPETTVRNVLADHDKCAGAQRGHVLMAVIEMDGLRCCHLSDLGHVLAAEQVQDIGQVDILCIPVGGHCTIDARDATAVVSQLKPKLVIPMHYLTGMLNREEFPLSSVDLFVDNKTGVKRTGDSVLEISAEKLPAAQEILVMNYTY